MPGDDVWATAPSGAIRKTAAQTSSKQIEHPMAASLLLASEKPVDGPLSRVIADAFQAPRA
jgi:hypothetical protein